ncbi:MAG: PaaI family thioesterase [Pyrinomonadaceae bacterium]
MSETGLSDAEQELLRGLFQRVRYAKLLGIELDEATRGSARMHMDARQDLRQVSDVLHGGSIASLIDTAAAFAVITMLEPDQSTTTSDLTIHYLRPVSSGSVAAEARVLRSGRRLLVVTVNVFDNLQALVATAVTTYIRLP